MDCYNAECPICFIPVKWHEASLKCDGNGCRCVYHKRCFTNWNKINKSDNCIICQRDIISKNIDITEFLTSIFNKCMCNNDNIVTSDDTMYSNTNYGTMCEVYNDTYITPMPLLLHNSREKQLLFHKRVMLYRNNTNAIHIKNTKINIGDNGSFCVPSKLSNGY